MKKLLLIPLLGAGIVVDVLMGAFLVIAMSAFLHANWWDAVPAFDFGVAALIGVVLYLFTSITSLHLPFHTSTSIIFRLIVGLGVAPLLLPWVVGELNNTFTAIPDISYGTSLVLALIGLGIAAVNAIVSAGFGRISNSLYED